MKPNDDASHVCIIDDEEGIRDLLGIVCESMGLPARRFGSAEGFLANGEPDLDHCGIILLDLDLPGMGGLQLIRLLRQRGCVAPIVIVSAEPGTDEIARLPDLGATSTIAKPFRITTLRARIQELLAI